MAIWKNNRNFANLLKNKNKSFNFKFMPTKIRLQRHGKKGEPFYHIVIADGRAPRDGKFIENIGTYNPLTIPADIKINVDRAVYWYMTGAQPTETVKAIFSYKGILYKVHLLKGVKKGAMTEEQADEKFEEWKQDKESRILGKIKDKELGKKNDLKKRLENEVKVNESKATELARKRAALKDAERAAKHAAETSADENIEEVAEVTEEAVELIVEEQTEAIADSPVEAADGSPAETPAETPAEETGTEEQTTAE